MGVQFKEGVRYIGIFFTEWEAFSNVEAGSLFMVVWEEHGKAQIHYRFRYYLDEKVWGSQDRWRWYRMEGPLEPDAILMKKMTGFMRTVAGVSAAKVCESIYINGDHKAAFRALANAPWAHIRKEKIE